MHIVQLDQEHSLEEVGGKAFHLSEMIREGLPVPNAVCVPSSVYHKYVDGSNGNIRQTIQNIEFEQDFIDELQSYIEANAAVAVRSSGVLEDTTDKSFAGQYDTFLNVQTLSELIFAIKGCWLSMWSQETLTYIENHLDGVEKMSIAVILQEQIESEVSGVLFTVNPLTGRDSHFLIESAWGLGEGVVSGEVNPDRIIYDWKKMEVISKVISPQSHKYVMRERGTNKIETTANEKDTHSVNENLLEDLVDLGLRVGGHYGYPQDIEWAYAKGKIYLLQTRPLTAIQFSKDFGQWTNANFVEVFPGFHNPFSFSLTGGAFSRTIHQYLINLKIWRNPPEQRPPWHSLIFGRTYWKVSEVKNLVAKIPGFNERSFDITTGIPVSYEGDGRTTPWTIGRIIWALPVLIAMGNEFKNYWKKAESYKIEFEEKFPPLLNKALKVGKMTNTELEKFTKELLNLHLEANFVAQYTSFLATQSQDDFHITLENLNKKSDDKISFSRLFTGLQDVKTAKPLMDLQAVAEQLKGIGIDRIRKVTREDIFESDTDDDIKPLRDYITKYAWMSETDEDLSCPRWYDDITTPLELIIKLMESDEVLHHPGEQLNIRLEEEEKARKILNRGLRRFNPFAKSSFWNQANLVKKYSWWREETREILARIYFIVHLSIEELFKRLADKGIIAEYRDLYSLSYHQLLEYLSTRDRTIIEQEVRNNTLVKRLFRNYKPPNTIGSGIQSTSDTQADLSGIGCSGGKIIGKVRVLRSVSQIAEIQEGEIAVVPHTNPGWTPIFSLIRGIVMEEGGLLSHGSVVAREYGIPAIIQVKNATDVLANGEIIEIDGSQGTIVRLG